MAYLIDLKTTTVVHLLVHHRFGRLVYSVDTLISDTEISKLHAIIEWNEDCWVIRDISTNGTWVNGIKLLENKNYQLTLNDSIFFAKKQGDGFQVKDLSPPSDYLVECRSTGQLLDEVVELTDYSILPSEGSPEIVLYHDKSRQQWCSEEINDAEQKINYLQEDDILMFAEKNWKIKFNTIESPTDLLINENIENAELDFKFTTSLDEESTQLILYLENSIVDFGIRTHHYLTLSLAKYRTEDAIKGLDKLSQGWVYTEQIAEDLGVDISHLNILVHRARKQFSSAIHKGINSDSLVQRRPGELRFGSGKFKVFKGEKLHFELDNSSH